MTVVRSRTQHRIPILVVAAMGVVAVSVPAQAAAVNLPRAGVICDSRTLICYTADGPSLSQTRREYGSRAEQDLLRRLSGRPPASEFTLSSGELCDLAQRTCWDDGNRRRNVSNRLTRQLWGGTATGDRTCQLRQRGRRLFDGSCRLTRRNDFNGTAYQIQTSDGRRYDFTYARDGRLVLRDATGTWPVTTSSWGNRVQFRWADLQLETFQRGRDGGMGRDDGSGGYGSGYGYGQGYGQGDRGAPELSPVSPGQALDTILNGLFK